MRMLRDKKTAEKLDCSRAQVWLYVKKDPTFPKPVKLGPRHTAWVEAAVDEWLLTRYQGETDETQ